MKTNVSPTSLAAYRSLRDSGELSEKELLVCLALVINGPMTREEIATCTGQKEGAACGRVAALIEKGKLISCGTKKNPITKKLNEVVDLSLIDRAAFLSSQEVAA